MALRFLVLALLGGAAAFSLGPAAPRCGALRTGCATMGPARIRTGDMVKVISGGDKGTTGKIVDIQTKKGKQMVVVEGVNMRSKHMKPMKEGDTGRIVKREFPVDISNVALSEDAAVEETAPAQ